MKDSILYMLIAIGVIVMLYILAVKELSQTHCYFWEIPKNLTCWWNV